MLKPIRRLGQNFLVDPNIVRKIVDAVDAPADSCVVEIGSGTGALTGSLSELYPNFVAVEIDERAVEILRQTFPGVDVRQMDILDADWAQLAGAKELHIVGNLPYYISSPILFKLLDSTFPIKRATIMLQLEVARRLVAVPRTKDYGILSVATQLAADVEILFKVSRNVFRPVPEVESAVVQLNFKEVRLDSDRFVREIIRTAFNQRRKTLRNSLRSIVNRTGRELDAAMSSRRPEELLPEEFAALSDFFKAR
ncbi:MAG: ribosomal RNA small subunit methyltransferase A [Rhodothermales bacterium]|nr:ribosomal RNA small subunit methyltransferase A [Rhodothermales bacterium]